MNILITGATSGMGKSIAQLLYKNGHQVIGCGRRVEDQLSNKNISWLTLDVTNQQSVDRCISEALKHFGHIDVLLQCAGRGAIGPVEMFSPEEIQDVIELNIMGMHRVNRAVIPFMRQQKRGRIIMISSMAAETGLPYHGIYCATKATLNILCESLRTEIKQFGIDACVIQPGDFKTEASLHRKFPEAVKASPYAQQFEKMAETTKRNVETAPPPERIAKKVARLVGKSYIRPKYCVAAPLEHLLPFGKAILPSRWFEILLMKYYGL